MFTLKSLILVLQLRITTLLLTPCPCLITQNLRLTSTFSHLIHHYLHAISVYVTQSYTSSQLHNIRASMSTSLLQRLKKMQNLTKVKIGPKNARRAITKDTMIIRTNRITFASDTPNSNHNEFKNNTNDFPKLDNFLNAQLYSLFQRIWL